MTGKVKALLDEVERRHVDTWTKEAPWLNHWCNTCDDGYPCLPVRLAEVLREKEAA